MRTQEDFPWGSQYLVMCVYLESLLCFYLMNMLNLVIDLVSLLAFSVRNLKPHFQPPPANIQGCVACMSVNLAFFFLIIAILIGVK